MATEDDHIDFMFLGPLPLTRSLDLLLMEKDIDGFMGSQGDRTPLGPIFFTFMEFLENFGPLGWCSSSEILDPPLKLSLKSTVHVMPACLECTLLIGV